MRGRHKKSERGTETARVREGKEGVKRGEVRPVGVMLKGGNMGGRCEQGSSDEVGGTRFGCGSAALATVRWRAHPSKEGQATQQDKLDSTS